MKSKSYFKAVVIVHGKSEKHLCQFIWQNLRIKIKIVSDKNGEKSIQINSLLKILNNNIFKSFSQFKKHFVDDLEIDSITKRMPSSFKIFTIMDTDDCSEENKLRYKTKEMFKEHWAYEYITPIFNIPNLENVLKKSGIVVKKDKMKEYIKIFPIYSDYIKSDSIQVQELQDLIKENDFTNMGEFLSFCLKQWLKNKILHCGLSNRRILFLIL